MGRTFHLMTNQDPTRESVNAYSGHLELERIARDLLTLERPVLYMGSSHRWGWNDPDPLRQSLLSRLKNAVPAMDLVHVPDIKPLAPPEYSTGISLFSGVPFSRLESIIVQLGGIEKRSGRILIFQDYEVALPCDHSVDARNIKNIELIIAIAEDLLKSGTITPWGLTPEGKDYQENLQKKLDQQRRTWTWDETKEMNIPEEFRHELAAGLDENAE